MSPPTAPTKDPADLLALLEDKGARSVGDLGDRGWDVMWVVDVPEDAPTVFDGRPVHHWSVSR